MNKALNLKTGNFPVAETAEYLTPINGISAFTK
jgi:hypothetical protein